MDTIHKQSEETTTLLLSTKNCALTETESAASTPDLAGDAAEGKNRRDLRTHASKERGPLLRVRW